MERRFQGRVTPEGARVAENYLQALQKEEGLKSTIKNNMAQDERQVYVLIIKNVMDRLYTDYIINNSPEHYAELTQDSIQSYINHSAYKMLRGNLRLE